MRSPTPLCWRTAITSAAMSGAGTAAASRPDSLDPENGAPKSLQTNAYPTANPELTEDGELFVYLSDSGSTDVTKTVASWGLRNGSSYTDQKAIPVDVKGYGDSDLHVAGDANGAAAVWVQQRTELVGKDAGDDLTAAEQALDGQQRGDHVRPVRWQGVEDQAPDG